MIHMVGERNIEFQRVMMIEFDRLDSQIEGIGMELDGELE